MKTKFLLLVVLAMSAIGCAHVQPPVKLSPTYVAAESKPTIGVVLAKLPVANTVETGSVGLLDLAIISTANGSLIKHLKQLDISEFNEVREWIAADFEKKGFNVVRIDEFVDMAKMPKLSTKVGFATRDFSAYKAKHGVDHVLVLSLTSIGTTRAYYGPVPTSEPMAFAYAEGQLIDLSNQQLLWYNVSNPTLPINGAWDEPDLKFPNITNTVYQALEAAKANLHTDIAGE